MRKPVQVSVVFHQGVRWTTVIADDGTMWVQDEVDQNWEELRLLPEPVKYELDVPLNHSKPSSRV